MTALSSLQDSKALSNHSERLGDCPPAGGWCLTPDDGAAMGLPSFDEDGWMCRKKVQSTNPHSGSFITYNDNNLKLGLGSSDFCGE
jgi:hypothetical protein